MRISSVSAHLLSFPMTVPLQFRYYGGERTIFKRDALLIRVATESGLVGYAPGPATPAARDLITDRIGPFLTGRLLADPDALRIQFSQNIRHLDRHVTNIYTAVEIALYDILGKALGVPFSELAGGRVRDRIRLYGSGGMYLTPDGYAHEAEAVAKLGFRAYKMRPGQGPEQDVEAVRRMRESAGPDFDLMVDAHTWWRMGDRNYSTDLIASVAEQFADLRVAWLEEPLPPHDHDAYVRLRERDLVPLAAGEHEPDDAGFFALIDSGGVDYVQMDVACQGGVPTFRRMLPEIEKRGLRFAFHSWGTALEVITAAHLGICWPDTLVEWLEYPCYSTAASEGMYPFPLAAEILKDPLDIDHGDLLVPAKPGLGVEVNEAVIDKYPWIEGPWSSFELDSPRERWSVTGDHAQKWESPA